jgi:hypothetical protein
MLLTLHTITRKEHPLQASDAIPAPFPPQRICILGAGQFGTLAAQRLSKRYPEASFLVVDERREKLDRIERDFGITGALEDIQSFFANDWVDDGTWIIPAIPVHFAFEWIANELKKTGELEHPPVPEAVAGQIPNPYRALSGSLCASFATFICPDSCNEPDEICTHTKSPRPGNLYEELARIELPGFDVIVVRSWQLAPGVGGYPRGILRSLLEKIEKTPESSYLIATSCRCHGVIDALRWKSTRKR